MNATQQQQVLAGLISASRSLGAAAQVLGGSGGAGGNITVPALYLDFLPPEFQDNPRDQFTYAPTDVQTLGAGLSTTASFTVTQDAGFLFTALSGHVTTPATEAIVADPPLTISILDSGSGRQLMNRPIHWQELVGNATLPCYLPYPKWIEPTSDVTVTYANLGAAALRIRLAFLGFKIFGIMK